MVTVKFSQGFVQGRCTREGEPPTPGGLRWRRGTRHRRRVRGKSYAFTPCDLRT